MGISWAGSKQIHRKFGGQISIFWEVVSREILDRLKKNWHSGFYHMKFELHNNYVESINYGNCDLIQPYELSDLYEGNNSYCIITQPIHNRTIIDNSQYYTQNTHNIYTDPHNIFLTINVTHCYYIQ